MIDTGKAGKDIGHPIFLLIGKSTMGVVGINVSILKCLREINFMGWLTHHLSWFLERLPFADPNLR